VHILNSRVKFRVCLPFIFVVAECTYENCVIRLGVFMFVALFNGSGYALLTAASPGATAPSRQQLSVMYAFTLMCEDAGGNLQSIHAKEGCVMHRELHDGFRLVAGCDGNGTDEPVCEAVLSTVSRAFTALSPCIPWASASMQRASVPSEHKGVIDWLCRSVRAMLTPSGLVSIVSLAPLVIVLSLKCTEFAICSALAAASLDCAVLQDDCICALSSGGMHDVPESDLMVVTFLACTFVPQHQVMTRHLCTLLFPALHLPAPCRTTLLRCCSPFPTNTTFRRSSRRSHLVCSMIASRL
jgi:hypothetical protein